MSAVRAEVSYEEAGDLRRWNCNCELYRLGLSYRRSGLGALLVNEGLPYKGLGLFERRDDESPPCRHQTE